VPVLGEPEEVIGPFRLAEGDQAGVTQVVMSACTTSVPLRSTTLTGTTISVPSRIAPKSGGSRRDEFHAFRVHGEESVRTLPRPAQSAPWWGRNAFQELIRRKVWELVWLVAPS
jgi:hypothetical protein